MNQPTPSGEPKPARKRLSYPVLAAILLISVLVPEWLPLTEGWTFIAKILMVSVFGLIVDYWWQRRA